MMESEYLPGFEEEAVSKRDVPVTCLGMTYENNAARRGYVTDELCM